ncbi:unnamed protein product [Hermetia illucens]|uniref:Coiled-coil domain-containing protein 28B n=1 Tax=Hermetia illucens TaxID=343691 RepID=A0A7R8US15_HERIL|nr:coiled-coil domain-containing protein 28A isoform X1 [Hermetia illucens]CAD7085974.1 unnamed protein product [Hermetia illucens]
MEANDELVERQKLVPIDVEADNDLANRIAAGLPPTVPITGQITTSVASKRVKSVSSDETTRSQNSTSIEQTNSGKAPPTSRIAYVNERRQKHQDDPRFDFQSRPRKILKDRNDSNSILPNDNFDDRPIKHHSFVSEIPDVKHMERALLSLLDDFHSGKLKAFGSSCTMEQMTQIREQQESLAKLHFELASADDDPPHEGANQTNTTKAQEGMTHLVQKLEQLSISIEKLQSSHTGG